jgi:hypothetical protein
MTTAPSTDELLEQGSRLAAEAQAVHEEAWDLLCAAAIPCPYWGQVGGEAGQMCTAACTWNGTTGACYRPAGTPPLPFC